jgi:glyoxylase I family protein
MRFFHTALSVIDIGKSLPFYQDVFGLRVKAQGERPELGVRFIMLEDENGVVVELFQHTDPSVLSEDLMDFSNTGIKHIAFIVEDVEAVVTKAVKAGATVVWEPRKGITVKRIAFIRDINNIPIELVEL